MARHKDTELKRTVESPMVRIEVSDYGNITGRLTAYREKSSGGLEEIEIKFSDLDMYSLACVANQAVSALRKLRAVQDAQIVQRLEFATGWSEGNGPVG